jgi:hypothetical protein
MSEVLQVAFTKDGRQLSVNIPAGVASLKAITQKIREAAGSDALPQEVSMPLRMDLHPGLHMVQRS